MNLIYQWKSEKGWEVKANGAIIIIIIIIIIFLFFLVKGLFFLVLLLNQRLFPTSQVSSS